MTIHELLTKRFATKAFDPSKGVSQEDLEYILEAARLSCSSFNTQPWKIVVVKSSEVREKLRQAAYGQPQITDASYLLVLCTVHDPMPRIETTAAIISQSAGQESADAYKTMVTGFIPKSPEVLFGWLSRQVYLALQAMILAAAERGIDSCPMEGFQSEAFAQILEITDAKPTALLPIGYALQPGHPKVRVPMKDIVDIRE